MNEREFIKNRQQVKTEKKNITRKQTYNTGNPRGGPPQGGSGKKKKKSGEMSTKSVTGLNTQWEKTQDVALMLAQTATHRIIWHWREAMASLLKTAD